MGFMADFMAGFLVGFTVGFMVVGLLPVVGGRAGRWLR
ncbi:hypothetical protein T261_7541 [Streptomyces lydicus]|nr:hypothetical protein T261_7541 [Streptomyces lydicus]